MARVSVSYSVMLCNAMGGGGLFGSEDGRGVQGSLSTIPPGGMCCTVQTIKPENLG